MDILLQQVINGLVLGSMYALVALGYTMVYGIIQLINFAHGELVMIGAMVAFTLIGVLTPMGVPGLPAVVLATLCAMLVCALLGYVMERMAYRPLRGAPRLAPLISAIGVSIILQNLAMMIWGRSYHAFPDILPAITFDVGGAHISLLQVATIALAALTMAVLSGLSRTDATKLLSILIRSNGRARRWARLE